MGKPETGQLTCSKTQWNIGEKEFQQMSASFQNSISFYEKGSIANIIEKANNINRINTGQNMIHKWLLLIHSDVLIA